MAIVVESIGGFSSATGTTLVLSKPSGLAVGDVMIAHVSMADTGSGWSTPSGWTSISSTGVGSASMAAFYKVADSGDVSASTFSFTRGDSGSDHMGKILRLSGVNTSNVINSSNSGTSAGSVTVTVTTITPSVANCLILFLIGSDPDNAARTASGYTLATSSPTFTEHYDETRETGANDVYIAAASGIRPQTTATGSATATLDGSDPNMGILIAIEPQTISPTINPATVSITLSIESPTLIADANISVGVANISLTIQAPNVLASNNPWSNTSKNSSSWTNLNKS